MHKQVTWLEEPQIKNTSDKVAWDDNGCQVRADPLSPDRIQEVLKSPPPTAIAATLLQNSNHNDLLRKPPQYNFVCNNVPTQHTYLFEPHGMDLLVLLEIKGVSMHDIVTCLVLQSIGNNNVCVWTNLDGTTLMTQEYCSESGWGQVYLADFEMPYPDYVKRNMTILKEKMEACPSPHDYIQGTRYYSGEALQLGILKGYDYFLKVDTDVFMNATIPFNMLHDMRIQGSIYGHTGDYTNGDSTCCIGIKAVRLEFKKMATDLTLHPEWVSKISWKGPCSGGVAKFERSVDEYYSNFIIMETKFWQSEPVRAFGKYFNEIYPGFFRYRWTDQPFFAMAMGLFVGPDFQKYTTNYTDLRCKHHPECCYFWGNWAQNRTHCQSGGYFHHSKGIKKWTKEFPDIKPTRSKTPFVNKVVQNCALRVLY
jgi:hypothetical protein